MHVKSLLICIHIYDNVMIEKFTVINFWKSNFNFAIIIFSREENIFIETGQNILSAFSKCKGYRLQTLEMYFKEGFLKTHTFFLTLTWSKWNKESRKQNVLLICYRSCLEHFKTVLKIVLALKTNKNDHFRM